MRTTSHHAIVRGAILILAFASIAWFLGITLAVSSPPEGAEAQPATQSYPTLKNGAPIGFTDFSGCMASGCHPEKNDYEFMHGPLFVSACDTCHQIADPKLHQFELARSAQQLCVFCHETEIGEGSMIHEPFGSGSCLSCHNPHGGSSRNLLNSEHYGDLCLSCHDDIGGARNLNHGPASAGACNACHQPHVSKERKLLERDGRAMCLECHVSLDIEIQSSRVVHEPVLKDCQLCHDPHETTNKSLLINEPAKLCVSCHEDIHQTIDNADNAHGAILTERSCVNCHSPHAADHQRLLKNDVSALCFECHNEEIERDDGSRVANIQAIIETGTSLHGPVAQGNCVACHEIHGGDNQSLLVREYSDKLYAPFDESRYALCFGCHDQSLVDDERTTTSSEFRNGDTNLHFVHVHRDKKGRTCSVCHDSHASNRDQHIHDTVPFGPGGWELPIYFQRIGDGGRCASGCHQSLTYSRNSPVSYPPRKEGEGLIEELKKEESEP